MMISKVKCEIEPRMCWNCHDSNAGRSKQKIISSGSPRGRFYGLNWSTGMCSSVCLDPICIKTKRSQQTIVSSANVPQRDVVRLEFENRHLRSSESQVSRCVSAFMDVFRSPLHRFAIVWASSEITGSQRRCISVVWTESLNRKNTSEWHRKSSNSCLFRCVSAFMDVLRSPIHRFAIVWASSEITGSQRRCMIVTLSYSVSSWIAFQKWGWSISAPGPTNRIVKMTVFIEYILDFFGGPLEKLIFRQ